MIIVAAGSFGFGFLRDFFDFTVPNLFIMWAIAGAIVVAMLAQLFIARAGRRMFGRNLSIYSVICQNDIL